jgi:hypothetical protein
LRWIGVANRRELIKRKRRAHRQDVRIDDLQHQLLARIHFPDQIGIGRIGSDAGVGQALDIGDPVLLALTVSFAPACKYRPTGRKS